MADNDNRRKLYDNINKEYDLPDYDQFSKDMEDDTKRKRLYDAVAKEYDLPDYNKFSQDMGYGQQEVQTNNQQNVQQSAQIPQAPQTQQPLQPQQTATVDSRHAEKSYDEQKAAYDKQYAETYNKLAKEGRVRMGIENHPNVKMVAVTDDLIKKFPVLEQSRGYQVPFDMNYGTPIMQNLNDKGDIITPDEAREQYTKILTNQNFDYVPQQETAAVQVGNVIKTSLDPRGGWLDNITKGSLEYVYGKDWRDKKYEIGGKEVGANDMYARTKQELYDDINTEIGNIRHSLLFATDEQKKETVDQLYEKGYLKEDILPKGTVLHYIMNVGKDEQLEELKQRRAKAQVQKEMVMDKLKKIPQPDHGETMAEFYTRTAQDGSELYASDLRKLDKQINQYDAVIDELEGRNSSSREWGHAVKTSGITQLGAWDFGITDLKDAMLMYPLARKVENGENITQDDYTSLKLLSQANDADAVEGALMPSSYNIKKGGLVSAPFTLQFMAGGEFAKGATTMADKAIARTVKGAIYKAAGKKVLSAAERLAEKAASNKMVSLVGMLGKDFRQAFFMENTTGAATTGAEILNRRNGTVTETGDGFDWQGETLPMAIYKGEMSQNIELQTEFLGEHFPSSLKFIRGMAHTKVGSAMGLRNMAAWLSKLSRKDLANTIRSYATKGGINGLWGEYMEEVAGTAENAIFIGDQKLSDLVDAKQQWETFGSVALSCIGMGIFGTAVYTGQRGLNMPRYYQMKHLQNKWDNTGMDLFSGDEWAQMKEKIDNTPNENAGQLLASIVRDQKLTEEQARAAFNYARCMLTLRGMNIGTMKAAQLGLTDDKTIEQDQSYVEGRETSDEDKHDVQIEYEDKTKELAGMLGISEQQLANMSDEELESLTGNDDKLDNVIYDYQNSHAKYQGVIDNADDNIDMAAQQAARQADMVTDKSRGTVRNATIKATKGGEDYGVYIVSGNIATNEDGSINVSESDNMILYYDPQTGKIEHADASRFAAIGEEVNAEEAKNQAIADAKEKAIRKEAGIIDGTVGEGTSFTITDVEGNEHTYEVLADNGDGTAMITLDGNVQDAPASLEDLQKLKDAEDAKKLEAAKLEREQHEKERELQREKDNAPVEDNLDYSEVINNDGKIEIADVMNENGTSMFPDAQEVFFIQNQGNRAKVMVLDNDGNLKAKMVKKSAVISLGTMSVDEYKEERQQMLKESGKGSETSSVEEDRGENENLQPIGKGTFGNIYNQFKGKVKEAFNFLISHKSGDLLGVFHRDDVGDIDLVWGNDKMGLAHIIGKHIGKGKDFENIDDAINMIDEVINKGRIFQESKNRYTLMLNGFAVGIRKDFDGKKKNWVVTAVDFNRTQEEKGIATNPTSTSHGTKESESTAALNDSQGKGTSNESNKQENSEKITLEDGTEVPMKEDGNPDFSQLTAKQTAELYDTQFGEDAEQIISDNVSKSKKALDNAANRKVTGSSFAEQKASKDAKDKAIAEAQEKYDSAKAVADAYNERQLAKEEDTPEGRQNLIDKARRKFNRMKSSVKDNAQAVAQLYNDTVGSLLHRLYDGTGIDVFDDTANTVEEYVASHIAPYSLSYDGTETSKGVKQETGLSRTDFAKTGFLAKEGKGKTIDKLAHDLWQERPENLQDITDQDVRNAIIDIITSGETAFGLRNYIQDMRIAQAERVLEGQKRLADDLAYAEERKAKEEEQQPTENTDNDMEGNSETSDDTDTAPSDDAAEDNTSEMPFDAPSADDAPFSAKDETEEQTPEERQAFVEKNRVNDIKLVDDVIGKKLRKSLERIAKMMGAKIQWQRTDMKGNGWFNSETNTIYLTLDSSITEGVQFIFGHEMTHEIKMKSPAMYDELKNLVKNMYGEDLYEGMTDDNEQRYRDAGLAGYDRSYYEEETVADAIGEMINDMNLAHSLALKMSHPLLAQVHNVLLKVKTAFFGTEYSDAARNAIRTIEQVYVRTANGTFESSESEETNGEKLSAKKRRALETASLGINPRSLTAISSADGAKILQNIDNLILKYKNSSTQPKTFVGEMADALDVDMKDKSSKYANFECKNGNVVTIRISDHNATSSNLDINGQDNAISIVVTNKSNVGITNDGNAHIVEYYYNAIKLRKAEGKPLADIVSAIKQALYSGEFKDPTGLAERQEVNVPNADERGRFSLKENDVKSVNDKFDSELQQQIDGNLEDGHIYKLGMPSSLLLSTGIPNLPIQLNSKRLNDKATNFGHDFDLNDVKGLVNAIQNPIAIFSYGNKDKAQNLVLEISKNGKNFIVGLSLNPIIGGKYLEINSVRNVFPKDNAEWLNWINQGKSLYLDKERIQTLIDQQRTNLADVDYLDLDSIAKVLDNFRNPKVSEENVANDDEKVSYSLRQKPEPEKKGIGYKVFVLGKDGKLYPPMVANPNGAATPVGVWLDADAAPIAGESKTGRPQVKQGGKGTQGGSGKLAYRPGWHLGVIPYALQFNRKDADGNKTLFPKNFVFAEVEYAADKDYQDEAHAEGVNANGKYQHSLAGLKHLPTDGYYMYRTNPNPETDPWVITGAMKVNRLLTRAEQAELVRKAGREPQKIQDGDTVTDEKVNSINQEIANAPKFSLRVYHGSGADFTEFDFDHMGEGAGDQVFGWGGYVTSSKEIGKSYAELMDNHNIYEVNIPDDNGSNYLDYYAGAKPELKEEIREHIEKGVDPEFKALQIYKEAEKRFHDEEGYDKSFEDEIINDAIEEFDRSKTVGDYYEALCIFSTPKLASEFLSSLGYTGIKYPAGTIMGGAKEGDMNYVIFKPEDMQIAEHEKFSLKEIKPIGVGAFGNIYDQFKGKAKAAIDFLRMLGSGEAIAALHHKDVGDIDLVWGKEGTGHSDGFGLSKLIKYHPEVLDNLQEILDDMHVTSKSKNRVNLESDTHKASVRLTWDGERKSWLLTAFKKETSANDKRTDTVATSLGGDTALSQTEGSAAKVDNFSETSKGSGEKFSLKRDENQKPLFGYFQGSIRDLIEATKTTGSNLIKKAISYASNKLITDLRAHGVNITKDYKHTIDNNSINHAMNRHSSEREKLQGQIPITENDIENIGDVIDNYDSIETERNKRGQDVIIYTKQYNDGTTFYIEEVRTGRKELAMQSIRKRKNRRFTDANSQATQISDLSSVSAANVDNFSETSKGSGEKFSLRLQKAIRETDTEPTDAQKKSGNYKKGHVKFGGYDYTIENPKGSYRSGVDENGKEWKQKMHDTYGYIRGTFGKDGDHLDMFINDKANLDRWNGTVYIVDQVNKDGSFDEHKVMYGYDSLNAAKEAYLSNYEKGWTGLGNISAVEKADFDKWLDRSNRKLKPFADYTSITSKSDTYNVPNNFEEFLEHPVVRFSIRNESERAAAEDAYNYAQENRPDKYSQYAIVNMDRPGAMPEYMEKKKAADNWRRYYNKMEWGNYKLFDLNKPFEDNVKNLVGKFPNTFRKENNDVQSRINKLTADYNNRLTEYLSMSKNIKIKMDDMLRTNPSSVDVANQILQTQDYKDMISKYQELMRTLKQLNELKSGKVADGEKYSLKEVNDKFNNLLDNFTIENADKFVFDLGRPSTQLKAAGVTDKPIRLNGSKLAKKIRKHGFEPIELKNLPLAMENPIAVFNNLGREGNRSVLTELKTANGNFLVSIDLGKGTEADFDIVSSVFGKNGKGVVYWINHNMMKYVDKEKALNYLHLSAPIAEASDNSELLSAANIVRNFENPKENREKYSLKNEDRKQAQLDIILKTNPMLDDYHTGIRKVEDIKTLEESVEEARNEAEKYDYDEWSAYPDITNDMLQDALETGEITIYSSKAIKNGVFVTPSYMQASDYAGGGKVYEKTVPLTDVAWINTDEGQYAKVDGEKYSLKSNVDNQGNPLNDDGTLKLDKIKSVDDLTDRNFTNATRNVQLPPIPQNVDAAIGANGKPIIIKKNIFEKNWNAHKFTPAESRKVLNDALYNTDLIGRSQPTKKPNHWVAIKLNEKSPITVLEVNDNKDNVEVVGWYTLDERNLGRIKRQAERNGGELIMLSPNDKVESLSTPPLNSAANVDNSSESTKNNKEKYSLIGKKGAANLDQAEEVSTRLDNLNVARQMEEAKKDAKAIKMATGWERGADGKWRYETGDVSLWNGLRLVKKGTEERATLGEMLEDGREKDELLAAYPQLKEMPLVFKDMGYREVGHYNNVQNEIVLNSYLLTDDNGVFTENASNVLDHEIQHVIQHIEGFAQGGNEITVKKDIQNRVNYLSQEIRRLKAEGKYDEAKELIKKNKATYNASVSESNDFKNYQSLAGEVEARNVQSRMGMSPKERRKSLAEETEDVARKDQIFLYGDDMRYSLKGVNNQSLFDAIHTLYSKGKTFAENIYKRKFFDVANTPDFMKRLGLTGNKFTIRYGVISRHFGKDNQHDFTEEEWKQIPQALSNPILITEYYQDDQQKRQKGYRLYTPLKLADGSYVVVSAEVKNAGRNLEINAINTIFGRNAISDIHDRIVYQNPKITPEQMALLGENNPRQYPSNQELSAANVDNSSESTKNNQEKYSLKDSKADRIQKLRESKPVVITGNEYKGKYELNRESAQRYLLDKLRDDYVIKDTGEKVSLSKKGAKKVTAHSMSNEAHLKSIAIIPKLIENSIFIDEQPAYKKNAQFDSYRYYVVGLKLGGVDYTARLTIGVKNGKSYYDHYLTKIEKGNLIDLINQSDSQKQSFKPTEGAPNTSDALSGGKDTKLISILQTNKENNEEKYSLRVDRYREELNQWKKDNNLPKDAEKPQLPIREPNESAADFLKRVKEYRQQAALWATAPTYEQHLLTSDTAQGQFNLEMQRKAVLTRMVLQDSMLAIRKAQEAIMKEVGVDKLSFAEDAYTAENRSHGKGKNEFEEYNDEFLQPLRKAYNDLMHRLGKSYDNVKVYMIAKHGLERNAHIAFKKALDEDYEKNEERMDAYNNYKADIDRLNNDADFEAGRIDFATWKQNDVNIRTKYAPSYSKYRFDEDGNTLDYSGLTALFDADDFESAAADLVKDVEDNNEYYTDELWYATNLATRKILTDSYKAGMMTEDVYNFVRGMYSNYIPLRGWGDTNADQVWNYVGGGKGAFNQTLKEAKGRKSLADDPIAYIENMAESGILMNNRNWVKQHLLLLAENHPTSLLNVSKAWYIKTTDAQGNEEWIPASPQITAGMNSKQVETALEAFEKKMEQMAQKGDATQKREHLEISYPQTNGEEREHEVRVMKNGEEYVIYINGDPQLAQAMNNTRARKVREGLENSLSQRVIARTGRYMAAAYTSLSPLFIPSNYMRDLTMTLASTAIREDARYNYLLRRNMLRHWNTFALVLRYQNGTLREKVRNGNASRVEEMFYDFMMNGGETGFVTSVDVEELRKKFRNDLKDMNRMAANPKKVGHIIMESIETLNRAIEDSNRFMIYMTSIEYGRSIDEAVNNAKDVTLNFNRKGTGEHGWQTIRNLYLFINPAIQSLQTLGALAKHHPFKFTAVTTAWMASGVLVPLVNNLLMSMFGGDDDKDKYWQFTKWDRRNNFIMWVPFTHEFVKIPLAQEFRGFYGIGDMIASKLWGGEKAEESWGDYALDLMGQIVDMLPLDPTGYDGNVAVSLMPNPIRPFFELAFNVDFTGKPLFKDSEYNKYDPNFTKAYVGTPEWLVRISRMVNSIGNDYPDVQQNWIDRAVNSRFNLNNPAVVDHVLSSYLGGAYTMGSQTLGVMTKALNGDEIKMADIPLASKFVSNPDDRPVSKKQGDEFWNVKERHDRAANTLSKLKKKAKVDGDYSTLDIFFGSDEYRQYKEDDKVVKKYEEDRKKEKAQETGEEYKAHKTTGEDVYKLHTTPKDDFEDMKMKQLYEKLNSFKIRYEAIDGISREKGDAYYRANKAAIEAVEDVAYDRKTISDIKKGFLYDGKAYYDADGMKDIRELRRRILDILEKANKAVLNRNK